VRIASALDARTEDRFVDGMIADGHEISGRPQSSAELLAVVESAAADVVLLPATHALLTGALLAACDARGIRVIAFAAGEGDRRHAAALGLFEVLDADSGWGDVRLVLSSPVTPEPDRPDGDVERGLVVAVWGPVGSPGRTTLAINLAAEAAARGREVMLADADSHGASVAPLLGLVDEAPGFAAACRLAGNGSLDRGELARVAQRYGSRGSSFRVLTGIARSGRWPELAHDRVDRVIAECRLAAEIVIVDTASSLESDEEISTDLFAPRRNAATLAALRGADLVIAVGLADPLGVSRFLRAHSELLDVVTSAPVLVVMNRLRSGAVGLGAASQLRSTLSRFGGIETVHLVPDDPRSLDAAVLAGRTLRDAAPRSPAGAAISRIADLLPGLEPPRGRRGRRVARTA